MGCVKSGHCEIEAYPECDEKTECYEESKMVIEMKKSGLTKVTQDQFIQLASGLMSANKITDDMHSMADMRHLVCHVIAATEKAMDELGIEVQYGRK